MVGYKQTDVGLIPNDWEFASIGKLAHIETGTTPPTIDRSNYGNDFLFVSPADLGENKWIEKAEKKLSKKGFSISRNFPKDSILFTCIGSTIGKAGIAKFELTSNQQINAILPNDNYSSEFVYYVLQLIRKKIKEQAGEQAVPMINKSSFSEFKIPLPPLPEQEAIAEVLSDTDALIGALEKRIAKKRLIKQGAMQTLLTPKDDWEVKKFDEVFEKLPTKNYQINSADYLDYGKYPVIDQGKSKIVAFSNKLDKVFRCRNNGIIIFGDHTREIKFVDFDFIVGADGTQIIRPKVHYNTSFLYYLLLEQDIPNTGYNRHFKFLLEGKYCTPKSKEEQTHIATILSDMDSEIDALEKKLSKTKELKQGLMQQLLTGKIRLHYE